MKDASLPVDLAASPRMQRPPSGGLIAGSAVSLHPGLHLILRNHNPPADPNHSWSNTLAHPFAQRVLADAQAGGYVAHCGTLGYQFAFSRRGGGPSCSTPARRLCCPASLR